MAKPRPKGRSAADLRLGQVRVIILLDDLV